jgi:hypothetical protein
LTVASLCEYVSACLFDTAQDRAGAGASAT